jgi:hypothetical protein
VKIFTKEEAEIWMKNKSVDLTEYALIQSEKIPNDSGRKNYISKEISNFKYGKECLLYINEYGIWPSSENMDLFNGYRKSIGINESLPEKPAHLINASENKELYCLLCMVLYFCWGAFLIPENTNEIIRVSHDEYIEVLVKGDISKRNNFTSEFSSIFN